jgi:hypothetical protein
MATSKRICRHLDGQAIVLQEQIMEPAVCLVATSVVETALARRLIVVDGDEETQDSVEFPPRMDCHWLHCQHPRIPISTILGLPEDNHHMNLDPTLQISCFRGQSKIRGEKESTNKCCACEEPHLQWKRTSRKEQTSALRKDNDSHSVSVSWIDLREIPDLVETQAGALHLLRSVLGPSHDASPWVEETADTTDDIVVLALEEPYSALLDFRVSDAAPSWFCHSIVFLENLEEKGSWWNQRRPSSADAPPATLVVYKRLSSRDWLSTTHPADPKLPTTPGCLWETYYEKLNPNDDQDNTRAKEPSYREQCPPYLNFYQDYPGCEALFDPNNIEIFLQEALRIPQWTPWPETQHYTKHTEGVENGNGDSKPWTVFPLCHCFPANQVDKFQWVQPTKALCPKTCDILQSVLGPNLRTSLFSQLAPNTTLEPHTGWSDLANHVVRLHIPLIVPQGDTCGTWVDGCVETHRVGRPLLFDDSKIHRAFNYSQEVRIVLIVDLARPSELPVGRATGGHSDELDQFIQQMNM